jgi:hypothetical protein
MWVGREAAYRWEERDDMGRWFRYVIRHVANLAVDVPAPGARVGVPESFHSVAYATICKILAPRFGSITDGR